MAAAYADTTATSFDITAMGLPPGKYVFRVQALAPENQPPPATSPPLVNIPFKNALLSGVLLEEPRSLNIVTGTAFPSFVVEASAAMEVAMEVAVVVQNGIAFAPIRVIAEALGTRVEWNSAAFEVTLVRDDGETLTFAIGQSTPHMDAPAMLVSDRTFVPVGFILEFFGASVTFDESAGLIKVIS